MDSINNINKLTKNDFISIFGNVFEKSNWIAEKVYLSIPFNNFTELKDKFMETFESETNESHLKILLSHPDLGVKQKMTVDSKKEQTHSELDKCSKEQIEKFKLLNKNYKQSFGFPFIVCVSGMDRFKILNLFEKRINNNKNSELEEAKIQVKKIALLRLEKISKE